ncbi:hypothetical protein VNO80_17535 [Phaseolus coccineus]|uniref:Uncharacterized protein n=1 Tax=Phaseolus coccineus TaxID=3886 RepID=A0AAN9MHP0_PHACN
MKEFVFRVLWMRMHYAVQKILLPTLSYYTSRPANIGTHVLIGFSCKSQLVFLNLSYWKFSNPAKLICRFRLLCLPQPYS